MSSQGRSKPDGPVAVVVGMEANGLGVSRALAAGGVACIGVTPPGPNPCRWTRTCRVVDLAAWNEDACIEGLREVGRRLTAKAPLLITKDEPVLWVARHRRELEAFYEINLPSDETVDTLMSKRAFVELAQREGWPVPRTWFLDSPAEFRQHIAEYVYPCILKPQVKNSAFREHCPAKAFKAHDQSELIAAYDLVSPWEPEVVVQEWIPGEDDRIAFCLSYCGRDGRPLALYAGRKLRQWPIDCGNTALAEPAPAAWAGPIVELTERIWRRVDFRGLGSVEFKMRPGTDEPVIMEPTVGRTNYQNELAVINGVNIPLIAYSEMAGLPIPAPAAVSHPVKLIDGRAESRAALAYRRAGRLSPEQRRQQRGGKKRDMIFRADDPGPYLCAVGLRFKALARRAVGALLGARARKALVRRLRGAASPPA